MTLADLEIEIRTRRHCRLFPIDVMIHGARLTMRSPSFRYSVEISDGFHCAYAGLGFHCESPAGSASFCRF